MTDHEIDALIRLLPQPAHPDVEERFRRSVHRVHSSAIARNVSPAWHRRFRDDLRTRCRWVATVGLAEDLVHAAGRSADAMERIDHAAASASEAGAA